jgi:hypothetical protein
MILVESFSLSLSRENKPEICDSLIFGEELNLTRLDESISRSLNETAKIDKHPHFYTVLQKRRWAVGGK